MPFELSIRNIIILFLFTILVVFNIITNVNVINTFKSVGTLGTDEKQRLITLNYVSIFFHLLYALIAGSLMFNNSNHGKISKSNKHNAGDMNNSVKPSYQNLEDDGFNPDVTEAAKTNYYNFNKRGVSSHDDGLHFRD